MPSGTRAVARPASRPTTRPVRRERARTGLRRDLVRTVYAADRRVSSRAARAARFRPLSSRYRCAVTGVPLVRDCATLVLHDESADDPTREGRFPRRIDSHAPYPVDGTTPAARRDYLGGFRWSPEFERYIKPALPRSVALARRVFYEWWLLPYVVEQLRAQVGAAKLDAVLAYKRDREDIRRLAARVNHTYAWITRAVAQCEHTVRTHYLPPALLSHIEAFAATLDVDALAAHAAAADTADARRHRQRQRPRRQRAAVTTTRTTIDL